MGKPFLSQCLEMGIVETVRQRHDMLIPLVIARFLPPQQSQGDPPGIKGVQHPIGPPLMLDAQLAHMAVLGTMD